MNSIINILTAKNTFIALLFAVAIVLVILAPKAAVNVDEQLHYPHAKKVVNWYFTGGKDKSNLETPKTNLKYYGQSVDNFTALFNRIFHVENEFLVRHLTGAFMFWLLLLFSGIVAKEITGAYSASVIALLVLLLMPRLAGQAFGNLKDIPFATGYIAGLLMIIRFLKEMPVPRWKTAVLLGAAIAFTVSVRAGGLILFAYLGLFLTLHLVWKPFELKQIVSTKPVVVRLLGQGIVIFIIGWFAGLLFWPFALQNVFVHPLESLSLMEHYKVSIRQIFEGNLIWSTQLPWYYLPKWFWIATPEFIFAGILVYLIFLGRNILYKNVVSKNLYFELLTLFCFLFPFLYVIAIHANLYSGVRQMLFILPPLAILVSVGMYNLLNARFSKFLKYPAVVFFFVLMLFPLKHQAATFPVDYVYFNSLSGGNKKAWSNFEYDYYFHAVKEPVEYFKKLINNNGKLIVAANNNLSNYFGDANRFEYQYINYLERSSADWDYGIFGVNYIHPYLLKNDKWQSTEAIKTFYHKGNPVAVILKRNTKNDLKGINAIKNGNQEQGVVLLKKALENDPNNVWLLVQLAKNSLVKGNENEFEEYIQKGRRIYPEYEPFYLLEAKKLFDEQKFDESLQKINELLQINARYQPAAPLLNALKEKLKIES